jgi:L-ascorbate metabolism protein UlaG (beta-lactamase superfamily)
MVGVNLNVVMCVKIQWLGHAAFMLESSKKVLIDPFITGNPVAPVTPDELNPDLIVVTHGHGDHLGDAVGISKRTGSKIVGIHEVSQFVNGKGAQGIGMNIGGTAVVDGVPITMTPATHSADIEDEGEMISAGSPAGVIIEMDGIKIYHTGDTGLFYDMKLIGDLYEPDVMLLPIGSWYTMGIKEAVKALELVSPKVAVPMHYNTFEVIQQDPEKFKDLAAEQVPDVRVVILKPGEELVYPE